MNSETRICQNCHQAFGIESEDFAFYEKIQIPPPTWCPRCRNMRRMAWREERSLYKDTCKLCGKSIISIHASDGPFTVYCRECWRSDAWDPMNYGKEYDFSKPFFEQYRELMERVPRPALTGTNLVNSEFSHACESVKNCYWTFWSYFSQDAHYCYALLLSKNAVDCYVADNSDHIYEAVHCNRLYKVRFGYFSDDCLDSSFLFDCVGCSDCFGCVNLRKQKYCLWNQKISKEEYKIQREYWDLGSFERLEEARKKFKSLYLSEPHRYAHITNAHNVTGDIIRDTKNCHVCFSALDGVENCKYVYFGGLNLKDSYDVSGGGDTSELLYEIFGVTGNDQRCFLSVGGSNSRETLYCDWAQNSSNIFGCIAPRNKKYCILNKQYSKEEYERLKNKIIEHMNTMPYIDKKGRMYTFGEFFPTEISAYAYNETFGFPWYPKTKEEVLKEGWEWRKPQARTYQVSMKPEDIPDHIKDAKDSILDETIGCAHTGACEYYHRCTTAFRLTRDELCFHREMNIALPRLCPNCRYAERLQWRNRFDLFKRKCECKKNHEFHKGKACANEFETTYAPGKPEILYCDACYKAEFL